MTTRRWCAVCEADRVLDHECNPTMLAVRAMRRDARKEESTWLSNQPADVREFFAKTNKGMKGRLGMRSHGRWSQPQGANLGVRGVNVSREAAALTDGNTRGKYLAQA